MAVACFKVLTLFNTERQRQPRGEGAMCSAVDEGLIAVQQIVPSGLFDFAFSAGKLPQKAAKAAQF
ncbi:MAG TPA: hypothetical protein VLZ56_11250, partial [Mycoplana sp.]|nr:hypothetical protein [Mycoplana sp.]